MASKKTVRKKLTEQDEVMSMRTIDECISTALEIRENIRYLNRTLQFVSDDYSEMFGQENVEDIVEKVSELKQYLDSCENLTNKVRRGVLDIQGMAVDTFDSYLKRQ